MSPDNLSAGEISNPQTRVGCFGFRNSNAEQSVGFFKARYFVVRTNNASGDQWTTNDYLVAFTDEAAGSSGNSVKIVAWKLQ